MYELCAAASGALVIPGYDQDSPAFDRLALLVNEVTGFRDGPGFRNKLETIFGGTDEETATTWLRRLARRWVHSNEWQGVVERLTVPETYFFRDGQQLDVLRTRVIKEFIREKTRSGYRQLRIWSAGCSSGEEPYTLAMLALDALVEAGQATETSTGIQPTNGWAVHVVGSDINGRSLEKAKAARYADYGLSPFRELPSHLRRFFVGAPRGGDTAALTVRDDVRAVTSFIAQNLRDGPVGGEYDIVSCRNVLIYFDDESKRAALKDLARSVRGNGCLMLGSTDPIDLPGFASIDTRVSPVLRKL